MQPYRKYQKTNEDSLQATEDRLNQNRQEANTDRARRDLSVVQIPAEEVSPETKAFLQAVNNLNNPFDIIPLMRSSYQKDGKDFNIIYKTIAEKSNQLRQTTFNTAHTLIDALQYRHLGCRLTQRPVDVLNNAYYSVAMDPSIPLDDRLTFMSKLTDTAKAIGALKHCLKTRGAVTQDQKRLYQTAAQALAKIAQKTQDIFERFQIESIAHQLIEEIFNTHTEQDNIDSLLCFIQHIKVDSTRLEYYNRVAAMPELPIDYFLEVIGLAKKSLNIRIEEDHTQSTLHQIDQLCLDRFANTPKDTCLVAIPNNKLILEQVSCSTQRDEFLISQAKRDDFPLLYRLHLVFFTGNEYTHETISTHIVESATVNTDAIEEAIVEINEQNENGTLQLARDNWDNQFIALAKNPDLSTRARLNAIDLIIELEELVDLFGALQLDSRLNKDSAYYSFLLDRGHGRIIQKFLMQEPDVDSLESFNDLYTQKLCAIQCAKDFYNAAISKTETAIAQTAQDKDLELELLESQKKGNIQNLELIMKLEDDIQQTYPLYKIVLEKSQQVYTIQDAIQELKLDHNQYLNPVAYTLPTVLSPVKLEGFDRLDFNFLLHKIRYFAETTQPTPHQTLEYTESDCEWMAILNNPDTPVIKDFLNAPLSSSNTYVLQLKTILSKIDENFKAAQYEKAFAILNDLIFNSATCYGGQLQAIENSYLKVMSQGDLTPKKPEEFAKNIVLNSLYTIRLNWVLENIVEDTEDGKYVNYTPIDDDGCFIADGPFMDELEHLLDKTHLASLYDCTLEGLARYRFLKNRHKAAHDFGRTHIGLDILGIAGKELGLRSAQSYPTYDLNIEAESWFLKNSVSDKANLVKAFVKSYTLNNIWQALADLIWEKTAESSKLEMQIYKDEAFTQAISSDDGLFISKEDPLGNGACRFLKALGLEAQNCCYQGLFYYKFDGEKEAYETKINIGFHKQGIQAILSKLGMLPE